MSYRRKSRTSFDNPIISRDTSREGYTATDDLWRAKQDRTSVQIPERIVSESPESFDNPIISAAAADKDLRSTDKTSGTDQFDDPLLGFDDPLLGFDDPLLGREENLVSMSNVSKCDVDIRK